MINKMFLFSLEMIRRCIQPKSLKTSPIVYTKDISSQGHVLLRAVTSK